jgi:hypothetical protein
MRDAETSMTADEILFRGVPHAYEIPLKMSR